MARQVTHDGSDHSYRMVIEDKYRRMAQLRKNVRAAVVLQIPLALLRTAWRALPVYLGVAELRQAGADLATGAALVLVAGMALFSLGLGRAAKDHLALVRLFRMAEFMLVAQLSLLSYNYYWASPASARISAQLPKAGGWWASSRAGPELRTAALAEVAVDVLLLVTCLTATFSAKLLLVEKEVGRAKKSS